MNSFCAIIYEQLPGGGYRFRELDVAKPLELVPVEGGPDGVAYEIRGQRVPILTVVIMFETVRGGEKRFVFVR